METHNQTKHLIINSKYKRTKRAQTLAIALIALLVALITINLVISSKAKAYKAQAQAQQLQALQSSNIANEKATAYFKAIKQLTANYNN